MKRLIMIKTQIICCNQITQHKYAGVQLPKIPCHSIEKEITHKYSNSRKGTP